jgi:O-antigen/teichoic acid export membrane protein
LKASSWTLLGYGSSQIIRFIGHLILARFLIPADFGLMQIVNVFVQGLHMFSDLGLGANIMQHKRGEEEEFLTTAWSVQIIRGGLLWLMTFIIAFPLAYLYEAPQLTWLLPIAGFGIFLDGLASTNLIVLNRRMDMSKLAYVEMVSTIVGITAMVLCAWKWQSVWTLLVSGIVGAIIKTAASHIFFGQPKMRWNWEPEASYEIIHFGKWIFFSSLTGFLVSRLDRIVLGLYMSMKDLGLYGIAAGIVGMVIEVVQMLSGKVLIPLYAHIRQETPDQLRHKVAKVRLFVMGLTLPPLYVFAIWGQPIMNVLYPKDYWGTGWMLRILAAGATIKVMTATIMPILIAVGNSYRMMIVQVTQSIIMIALMIIGGHFYGVTGLVLATAISDLINYPILVACIREYDVWLPWLDLACILSTALLVVGMLWGYHA